MRKIPGAPELLGTGRRPVADAIAVYRARHAGAGALDFARLFLNPGVRYRSRPFVAPDVANRSVPARGNWEDQFSLRPGSFLVALSSRSAVADGFRFSVTDAGSGERISSGSARNGVLSGEPAKFAGRGGPFFLPAPWVVSAPGLVLVQITNLAPSANEIDLLLYFAEPL